MALTKKKAVSGAHRVASLAPEDCTASMAALMLIGGLTGLTLVLLSLFNDADWEAYSRAFRNGTAFNFNAVVAAPAFWKSFSGLLLGGGAGYGFSTLIPRKILSQWNWLGKILLIVLPVLVLYLPTCHADFIWDDDLAITNNLSFRIFPGHSRWAGLWEIWCGTNCVDYFPIKTTMFWVEYQLWGADAGCYHGVNFILHALDSVLLWLVLRRLSVPGAWLAAFVFAIDPVHVESVAWVAERKNTLSLLFYLMALWSWFNYQEKKSRSPWANFFTGLSAVAVIALFGYYQGIEGNSRAALLITPLFGGFLFWINRGLQVLSKRSPQSYFYISALCFFVAGLLCKSHLVVLPLVLLLLGWWQNGFSGLFNNVFEKTEKRDCPERSLMKITNGWIGAIGLLAGIGALFYLVCLTRLHHANPNDRSINANYLFSTGAIPLEFWILAAGCILSSLVGLVEGLVGLPINRVLVRTLAFFQVAVLLGAVTVCFQYGRGIMDERIPQGAIPSRIANVGKASWWYLTKSMFPLNPWFEMRESRPIESEADAMAIVYDGKKQEAIAPRWPTVEFKIWPLITTYPRWRITPPVWYDFIPALLMTALLGLLWLKRNRWGRTPFFVLAYFLVTLLPIFGLLKMSYMRVTLVADHFQYLSDISIIAFFCAGGTLIYRKLSPGLKPLLMGGAVLLIGAFIFYSWDRVKIYENERTLWADTLLMNPESWQAHNHMGTVLFLERNNRLKLGANESANQLLMDATRHFAESCRLKPENPESHRNLALAYVALGWKEAGIEEYRRAIQYRNWEPAIHTELANCLALMGRSEEGIVEYNESIRLNPGDSVSYFTLGYVQMQMGRRDEAIVNYRKALELNPNMESARSHLEKALKFRAGDS